MPLKLDILANTRQFVTEAKKAGASVEDISDSLDDLKRDGETDLSSLERGFRDLAREGATTGRKIGTDLDDGFDRAKKGADEFKDEAAGSAREAAASFDGSAESIGDVFQEVAANAFGGFGPAGAAAGIAAAAGLGVALTAITNQQAAVDALKEKFVDAYKTAAEEGRTFLDDAQIQSLAIDIFFDQNQREAARKDAEKLGVDLMTAVRAQAGDQDALAAIIEAGNQKVEEGTEKMRERAEAGKNVVDWQTAETAGIEQLVGKYEGILELQKDNEQAARDVKELREQMSEEDLAQIERGRKADQARYEALAQMASKGVTIPVTVDGSAAYRTADQIRRDIQAKGIVVPITVQDLRGGRTWE